MFSVGRVHCRYRELHQQSMVHTFYTWTISVKRDVIGADESIQFRAGAAGKINKWIKEKKKEKIKRKKKLVSSRYYGRCRISTTIVTDGRPRVSRKVKKKRKKKKEKKRKDCLFLAKKEPEKQVRVTISWKRITPTPSKQ